ncbi:hypothetical protein GGR53DRAFT_463176 [Hypoxylon sp. FL1150]|nr:hypothetical protein GGR53DRAFT_463176 [Hypoxylon sp. FL1150]
MGRLEPSTSLALGRSPYDNVVPGEGEADPHEPDKQYDGTGRIVNPTTKQIIKEVIRAHNEVMQVIGVAEPENGGINAADRESAKLYHDYETDTGKTVYHFCSALGILGTWGVLNIRRRILVYKTHADVSFVRLLQTEYNSHSLFQLLFAGYPCHFLTYGMNVMARHIQSYTKIRPSLLNAAVEYARFHLHLFFTMQRLDLIPASQWFPDLKFFVPFSSSSPFAAPPLPESFDVPSVTGWVAGVIGNVAPYATFYVCGCIWRSVCTTIRSRIRKRLPRPLFPPNSRTLPIISSTERQPIPESPTLGAADQEIRHETPEDDVETSLAVDVPSSDEPIPVGSIRRQSTFSSRGDDYGTDDEDAEMVNPTLISFDVDTSESTEPPTGVWSAELRPSYASDSRQGQPKEAPIYIVNPLTCLPSMHAADILADFVTNIITIPLDCHAFPIAARAFAQRRGIPFNAMDMGGFLGGLTWQGLFNIVQLDVVRLLISGEIWCFTTILSQWLHVTEEEWKEMRKEEEEQEAMRLLN